MNSPGLPKIYLYRRIVQAKLFIDANYREPIDLERISDEAFFSKFHFARLFRNIYGQTPHQYLQCLRMEKAKQLLRSGYSVSHACYNVGFESLGSFSSLFTKVVGENPSAYLRREQQLKALLLIKPLAFIPGCFAQKHGWREKSNIEEMLQA